MKDIHITTKRQKTELIVFGTCFLLSFVLNIISIIVYKTEWTELYSQICWMIAISLVLYFLAAFFRLIYWFARHRTFSKK